LEKLLQLPEGITKSTLSVGEYFITRGQLLLSSLFVPVPEMFLEQIKTPIVQMKNMQFLFVYGNYLMRFYTETFLGGFTVMGMFLFALAIVSKRNALHEAKTFLLLLALGALTILFANPDVDHMGQAFNMMGPLLIGVFVYLCSCAANLPRKVLAVFAVLMFCEYIFIRVLMYHLTILYLKITLATNKKIFVYLFEELRGLNDYSVPIFASILIAILLGYQICLRKTLGREI